MIDKSGTRRSITMNPTMHVCKNMRRLLHPDRGGLMGHGCWKHDENSIESFRFPYEEHSRRIMGRCGLKRLKKNRGSQRTLT